jgi:hypothetical protein
MKKPDVNRLITDEVDEVDDKQQRQFIKEILMFERDNLDQQMPRYSEDYKDLVEEYVSDDS